MKLLYRIANNKNEVLALYAAFAILIVLNGILDKNMLKPDRIMILATQAMPLIMIAMGQTIVMLTGGIDLSVGNVTALMSCIAATVMNENSLGLIGGFVVILLSGAVVGLVNGTIITYGKVPAIIVTLAMSFIWLGVALIIRPTPGGLVDPGFVTWYNGGSRTFAGVIFIIVPLVLWKYLKTTRFGVSLYAIGDNAAAAFANGVPVRKIRVLAYMCAGMCIGLAGIGLAGITGTGDPNIGATYTMNAIAASVLGGAAFTGGQGQMRGMLIGAMLITSLMNILFFSGLSPFYQYIVQGFILIAAISLKTIYDYRKGALVWTLWAK